MKKSFFELINLLGTYSFGNIAQKAIVVFLIPLYTSYLTPKDYGIFALVTLAATLATKLVSSPITYAIGRYYYRTTFISKRGKLLYNLLIFLVFQSIILAFVFRIASYNLSIILFNDQQSLFIIKMFSLIVLLMPLSTVLTYYVQLKKLAKFYVIISMGTLIITVVFNVLFLVILNLGLISLVYTQILGLIFTLVFCLPHYLGEIEKKISWDAIKEPLKFGYPQLTSGYANLLVESGDKYLLKIYDSVNSVGLYSFGVQISSLLRQALITPLGRSLEPIIFQMEKDQQGQKQLLRRVSTHYYLIGIFLGLILSVFANEVVNILVRNDEFLGAVRVIPMLNLAFIQFGLTYFVGWGLVMKDKAFHISANLIISAIANILLNIMLIPIYGILGAAMATVLTYMIWNALKMYFSAKFYNLHFELLRLLHITIIGVGLYMLSTLIPSEWNILYIISAKALICCIYLPILFVTRFFKEDEKNILSKFVSVAKTGDLKLLINYFKK